ncbi:TPA: translation elongation factor [Bacillus cereus]|nr:translation elongation factor [Bacillus cereus]HDR4646282.1 translation elongation factor [Bacillus cereus]HDR4652228.1 translation elongation factor [Bacillus cereus]HDR4674890.1 translation elongation factor [Bacillus cereus]HDR4680763.1 translation elongation factor [Bacillus cereus]
MNQTDKAWDILFDRHNILQNVQRNGFFEIQAKEIKKEREPRLMAKFDHYSNLPKLFKDNGLSILPISRSSYIIGEFDVYEKVTYNQKLKPIQVDFPSDLTTIDPTNLYSESSALHCAHVTGMMENVLGEQSFQTISGRMSSKEFDFNIRTRKGNDHLVSIKNSQVEIDGGYESQSQFMIVEAKNATVDDFLVRQLYYPYRLWQAKTYKEVKPVFFTYSNDIFSFFIYEFTDPHRYNSAKLIGQKDFIIAHEELELEDIVEVFHTVHIQPEPEIPFPQADSFPRIVDLLGLLVENDLSKDDITRNYDFDERQTGYYTAAGMYLGLIEKYKDENRQVMFTLTRAGRGIMRLKTKEKFLRLAKSILVHEPFKQVLAEYFQTSTPPEKERVVEIMKRCNLYNVNSESTYFRRASTVMGWINWILELPETY